MAAPDRMDLVPISDAVKPKVVMPPPRVQELRILSRRNEIVSEKVAPSRCMVLMWVEPSAEGTVASMRLTREERERTGHSRGSWERCWVRFSLRSSVFWKVKVTVTRVAS